MLFRLTSLALAASLVVSIPTTTTLPRITNEPCSTAACNSAAEYIRVSINESVDPCSNFYEYACGGWIANHTIPPSKSRTGTFDLLNEQMDAQIRRELYAVNVSDPKQSQSVRFAAHLFHKCLDVLNEHENVGWDNIEQAYVDIFGQIKSITWDNLLSHTWSRADLSPIFKIYIGLDPKINTVNIINIDSGSLGLGQKELSNPDDNKPLIAAYKKYIHSVAEIICKKGNIANCESSNIDKDVDAIVNFETELAKIRLSPEKLRDPDLTYNKFTLNEFKNKTGFDWQAFFTNTLNEMVSTKKIDGNFKVLVTDVEYVVKAIEILKKTDQRTLSSYFGWKVISSLGSLASEQYRKIQFEFEKVRTGIQAIESREKHCQKFVYGTFSMALSRLFVTKYFSKQEKDAASLMIDSIQASFQEIITTNDWLDEVTRAKSIEKLNKVTKNVAYPDWIMDDKELDDFFYIDENFFNKAQQYKNYLISYNTYNGLANKQRVESFDNPRSKDKSWPMPPAIINAAYEPVQNSITIPAGILKAPFFDSERPYSINYGFIGMVIGHEFTHGFDDQGSEYDLDGNQKNWWTEAAKKAYKTRAQCFVDEYSSKIDKTTGLHLNGENTLGENIADNGGLKEAYQALKARENKEGKMITLKSLPQFDSEKLFFLSFAQTWCSLQRRESLKNLINYDPHSPPQFRVEVPSFNSDAFQQTFKCPPKPDQHNCKLW